MELKFQKTRCRYLEPLVDRVQNQELTQEIRLTDGMPDIGRVLAGWAQVILRSKEWQGDNISFSGGMMVWVLYAPEDGSSPRCVESWIPFQMKWDMEGGHREGTIRIRCIPRFVDARSVAPRKIMLRAGVAARGEAMAQVEGEYGTAGELPEDVQLRRTTYPIVLAREAGEKTFLMDEDLVLPGSAPVPERIVYYTVEPKISDIRITGNKVVFRGDSNLHMLYMSGDGQLHSWDFSLPFSQFGELEGSYSGDARGDITMGVTSLELNKDEENHLRLKCALLAQYVIHDREMLELVTDVYSPMRQVEMDMGTLELPAILEQRTENVRATQSVHQDANLVVEAEFLPDFPRQRRTGETVQMELPGQFQVLYYDENGAPQSAQSRWEGDYRMEAGEQSRIQATLTSADRVTTSGQEGIDMAADTTLGLFTTTREGIPMVTGLRLGEPRIADPNRPSVILRRAGDGTLWDIAKSTGTTVDAIRKANSLETEPVMDQILLIPVL